LIKPWTQSTIKQLALHGVIPAFVIFGFYFFGNVLNLNTEYTIENRPWDYKSVPPTRWDTVKNVPCSTPEVEGNSLMTYLCYI